MPRLQPSQKAVKTVKPKMTAVDVANFLGVSLQAVHKQLRVKGLTYEKSQNRVYFGHDTTRALLGLSFSPKIVAAQIVKGGVGKTSLVFALAVRTSLYGARVLCVDMDQQGNLTQALGCDPEQTPCMVDILNDDLPVDDAIVNVLPGLDLLPSRIENAVLDNTLMLKRFPLDRVYRDRFEPLRSRYDVILIDCPPALGQSVAAIALATDLIIAPVVPEKFSLSGLKVTTTELKNLEANYKRKIQVKIALNKFDNRTVLSHEVLGTLLKHQTYGNLLFKSYVRTSQEFQNSLARGLSVFDSIRGSPAKEDVDLLTQELVGVGAFSQTERKAS